MYCKYCVADSTAEERCTSTSSLDFAHLMTTSPININFQCPLNTASSVTALANLLLSSSHKRISGRDPLCALVSQPRQESLIKSYFHSDTRRFNGDQSAFVMSLVEEWWKSVPPVTRSYICLSVITTGAVALEVITPFKLYLDWKLVLQKAHVWRVFTNFLFFGNFSLDFLFHMFFLYRYCKMLETNSFRGRTADFLYMLLFGAALLVLVSPLTSIDFLGPSLTFMMVYVWGRRNSRQAVGFLGVLNFRAPYLPWVLLIFSFVLGSSPSMDMLGILAGHVYYYMADVYPSMAGVALLKTPRLLQILVGNNDDFDNPYDVPPDVRQNPNDGVAGWGQGRMLDGGGQQ